MGGGWWKPRPGPLYHRLDKNFEGGGVGPRVGLEIREKLTPHMKLYKWDNCDISQIYVKQ